MGRMTRGLRLVCTMGAVTGAILGTAGGATAVVAPSFSVTVAPGTLSAGSPAIAIGTFTNNGPAADGVAVTFTFPFSVKVLGNNCATVPIFTKNVVCLIGKVGAGQTVSKSIEFTVPSTATGKLTVNGVAGFISSAFPHGGLLKASGSGTVFAAGDPANVGTCSSSSSGALSATANDQTIALPTLPTADPSLGLPCTPLSVSVTPPLTGFQTNILSVELPKLQGGTTHVDLSFPDELLPQVPGNEDDDNTPQYLYEITSPLTAELVTKVIVPMCVGGTFPAPAAGYSTDSCIFGVTFNDPDGDNDAGTLDVLVQGSGFGDPHYGG